MAKAKLDNKNLKQNFWKSEIYKKVFWVMVACTILVVTFFALFIYNFVKQSVLEENRIFATDSFRNVGAIFEEMEYSANSLATDILLDDTFDMILFGSEENINITTASRVIRQLKLKKSMNEMVESIYLYNAEADVLLTDRMVSLKDNQSRNSIQDKGITEIIEEYEKYRNKKFVKRTVPTVSYRTMMSGEATVYTYFLDYFKYDELQSVVILNLSESYLREKILAMENTRNSYIAVFDESESPILEVSNGIHMEIDSVKTQLTAMRAKGEYYREFIKNGERYFMLYLVSEELGWDYVKINEWNDIFAVQTKIKNIFLIMVLTITILAILISRKGAYMIYQPYLNLEKRNEKLLIADRKNQQAMKSEFLFNFVTGRAIYPIEETELLLDKYKLVKEDHKYTLAILKIANYEKLVEQVGKKWIKTIKFGFSNIFEEIANDHFFAQGVMCPDEVVLFVLGTEKESIKTEIETVFRDFCDKQKAFLNWEFQLMTIDEYVDFQRLPELKNKMWMELSNLFFYDYGTVVSYKELCSNYKRKMNYEKFNQKDILEAVYSGKLEEVVKALEKLELIMQDCCAIDYRNALIWVATSVVYAIDEYKEDLVNEERVKDVITEAEYIRLISNCDTAIQAKALLMRIINTALEMREKVTPKLPIYKKMEDVDIYIEREFKNPNLSLDLIADEFAISPLYLGRQYKKYKGKSVGEHITIVRLEEAAKQIQNTQKPIKTIALECGFGEGNYFYTLFKKKMGMSPQVYREKEKPNL